ncbi:MAG: TlpA family protein disulfide reductase [Acidobacteria bacterium]|nr:TlpA family protein disulfide reductase [Acidobacteriota bacterium]
MSASLPLDAGHACLRPLHPASHFVQPRRRVQEGRGTYCPPCRDEIPHLVALQRRLGPQGLKVVGLNVGGAEDQAKVPDYVKALGIQYQLANPDNELISTFLADNDVIPQTFVFDRQGRLVEHFVGFDDEVSGRLEDAIQTALATKAD